MTAPIIALVEKLLNAASARLWMHETDGHLANEKLINWRVLQEKRGEPSCSMQKHTVKSYCILYWYWWEHTLHTATALLDYTNS